MIIFETRFKPWAQVNAFVAMALAIYILRGNPLGINLYLNYSIE